MEEESSLVISNIQQIQNFLLFFWLSLFSPWLGADFLTSFTHRHDGGIDQGGGGWWWPVVATTLLGIGNGYLLRTKVEGS